MSNQWVEPPTPKVLFPDMKGKRAVVSGVTKGIGRSTAELLIANGVEVLGLARSEPEWGHDLLKTYPCDLSDAKWLEATFREITSEYLSLDYVVNIAGYDPKFSIDEVTTEQWDQLVDLNLRSYYFMIKHSMQLLRKGDGKAVVNVSSINYRLGVPGRAVYAATKAGNLGLTTGLARELGKEGIRVNTVTPGWTFTQRQAEEYFEGEDAEKNLAYLKSVQALPMKVMPEDIANHIVFYLSHVSRASTGHNCVVDGGWLLE